MHLRILQSHDASYQTQSCSKNRSGALVRLGPKNSYSKLIFRKENFRIVFIKIGEKTMSFINLYLRTSRKPAQIRQILDELENHLRMLQNENIIIVVDLNCFDDENRKTFTQCVKHKLIFKRLKEMGFYDVAEELNQNENIQFSRNHTPARLDYILIIKFNPSFALELIQTMYSNHKIPKLCLKKNQEQDQIIFRMDDAMIKPNQNLIDAS